MRKLYRFVLCPQENGRAPSPEQRHQTRLAVMHLTRNVTEGHLREIFGNFGELKTADLSLDKFLNLPRGFGHVEFILPEDARKAQAHMDGGYLDGNKLSYAPLHSHRIDKFSSPS